MRDQMDILTRLPFFGDKMKPYWATLVLIAACGDGGPVTDDVKGGNSRNLDERSGCIETQTRLASVQESGLSEADVQTILNTFSKPQVAELVWLDGSRTQLTGTFANIEAFKVESREDPKDLSDYPRSCVGRVILKMDVGLTTSDGRLAESLEGVVFDREGVEGAWKAFPHQNASDLAGTYESQLQEGGTLTALYFDLSLNAETFAGAVNEETQKGDARGMSASLAHWSSSEP